MISQTKFFQLAFSIIFIGLFSVGCGDSNSLPPIENLVTKFTESIKAGNKERLSRCFVRFEAPIRGGSPTEIFEQQSRKQYYLAIINDLFPENGTTHNSVKFAEYEFANAERLVGKLHIIKKSGEELILETDITARMSISGWKIANIIIKEI